MGEIKVLHFKVEQRINRFVYQTMISIAFQRSVGQHGQSEIGVKWHKNENEHPSSCLNSVFRLQAISSHNLYRSSGVTGFEDGHFSQSSFMTVALISSPSLRSAVATQKKGNWQFVNGG